MAVAPSPRRAFHVVAFRNGNERDDWCWEIRRKRRPMGIRLMEEGFHSSSDAQAAGRIALEAFLNGLAMEPGSRSLP